MSVFANYKRTISLLPSAGLIFRFLFIWSQNLHMYRGTALLCSITAVLLSAVVLFFINSVCIARLTSYIKDKKKADILFYIIIAVEFIFFVWHLNFYRAELYKNQVLFPVFTIITFFILYKKRGALLVFFSCIMLIFSLINLTKNSIINFKEMETTLNLPPISLKTKPNIYLFWLESYHSTDILESTFGFDNSKFTDFLTSRGFHINKDVYSSGECTLKSMAQLYLCNTISSELQVGNNDVASSIRDVISGNPNNIVFRILKENGYKTILLTQGSSYFFHKRGKFLDETDFDEPSYFFPIIDSFNMSLESWVKATFPSPRISLSDHVKAVMAKGREWHQPYIIAFKGGANHTPLGWSWKQRDKWIKSNYYQGLVRKANEEAQELISYILQQDPGALIVLLGDHGALTYQGLKLEDCDQHGVALQDIFDDRFKVFFAYRLPNNDTFDLSSGMYMNNINVFIHIFSYLSQDKSLLRYRVPSESVLEGVKMIEGKLLPPAEK